MADHDYQKDYWDKIHSWNDQRRAERKANENHSMFTLISMVGFVAGVGLFYQTAHVVAGTIALTALGAILGAGIDYIQVRSQKKKL